MSPTQIFWVTMISFLAVVIYLDKKYLLLRDQSTAQPHPYSFARTQLTWWTIIVISSMISIVFVRGAFATLLDSTLVLLGMSAGTSVAARIIDVGDEANPDIARHQDLDKSQNFLLDILSDENGVSIHRLQTVIFNVTFGIWFLVKVLLDLNNLNIPVDEIMPPISDNNLILLGLSSATYVGLKVTENKKASATIPEHVPDESKGDEMEPVG